MYRMQAPTKTSKIHMRTLVVWIALLLSGISGCENKAYRHAKDDAIQVCFSPGGNCTKFIQEAIAKAKKTILVQAYFFTSRPIADALISAHQQGIAVRLLVDRSQLKYKYTQVRYMARKGIPVYIDQTAGIAHNKVMIIDNNYVLTGSFNWTKAAEHCNAENLLLIRDKKINQAYKETWRQRMQQAAPFVVE